MRCFLACLYCACMPLDYVSPVYSSTLPYYMRLLAQPQQIVIQHIGAADEITLPASANTPLPMYALIFF